MLTRLLRQIDLKISFVYEQNIYNKQIIIINKKSYFSNYLNILAKMLCINY